MQHQYQLMRAAAEVGRYPDASRSGTGWGRPATLHTLQYLELGMYMPEPAPPVSVSRMLSEVAEMACVSTPCVNGGEVKQDGIQCDLVSGSCIPRWISGDITHSMLPLSS